MTQTIQKIKTNVKFQKNDRDQICGFVTKNHNGSWKGCREKDDVKKKIVIVDTNLENSIILGALYKVSLIPMNDGKNGFVAVSAELVQFTAQIETDLNDNNFCVKVRFGNKTIIYDPTSKIANQRNENEIYELIKNRVDLVDSYKIAEEFRDCAFAVKTVYNRQTAR